MALAGIRRLLGPGADRATVQLRWQLFAPLALAILTVLTAWVILLYSQQRTTVTRQVTQTRSLMDSAYRNGVAMQARLLGAIMETITHNDALMKAMESRDREALFSLASPMAAELRRHFGITHFYFLDPERKVVLRAHQPHNFGDIIERITTAEAARTGTAIDGMELGESNILTQRRVSPWRDGTRLIGYVELGIDLEQILGAHHLLARKPLFPLLYKSNLDRSGWEAGMRMLGDVPNWDLFPSFVIGLHSGEAMPGELADQLAKALAAGDQSTDLVLGDAHYSAVFLPLIDVSGKAVGQLLALIDVSAALAESRQTFYAGTLVSVVIAVLLVLSFNRLVIKVGARLESHEEELKRLAIHDGLTGLRNQLEFYTVLEAELERAQRTGRAVSLLLIDIDDFKKVNDRHGHQAGNLVLKELAELLTRQVRTIDSACRYGGEEFAVILPETELAAASSLAERIRAATEEFEFSIGEEQPTNVTISIGVASYPAHAANTRALFTAADTALYEAKNHGKNRVSTHAAIHAVAPGESMPLRQEKH
ncbi:MAG: GGDEF domain-containing protein [Burkholderiaceae bacterium]|nr:GGDEF domain-containing protein [Burkholderiaceae bacterium]